MTQCINPHKFNPPITEFLHYLLQDINLVRDSGRIPPLRQIHEPDKAHRTPSDAILVKVLLRCQLMQSLA